MTSRSVRPVRRRAALAALALPLLLAACSSKEKPANAGSAAPPPLPDDVASLAPATAATAGTPAVDAATLVVESSGEMISTVRSELVARQPGRVGRILVEEGDSVAEGEPLLELETQYLSLESQRATADLARAEAAFLEAKRDFDRKAQLRPKESVSEAALDRSTASFAQATAQRDSAAAAAALAKQRLADAVLRSPVDGVVEKRLVDVGERLGDATVAFIVVRTRPLRLRFEVPERHFGAVRKGQSVTAQIDPFPGETFSGKVTRLGQVVDAASRTFFVESEFANADGRLRPGLFARVRLELGKGR